ncbi:hypothetical protein GCM10027043_39000 [Ferruginibacter profundus]
MPDCYITFLKTYIIHTFCRCTYFEYIDNNIPNSIEQKIKNNAMKKLLKKFNSAAGVKVSS